MMAYPTFISHEEIAKMSTPTDALAFIQQSGQALHNANLALEQTVKSQSAIALDRVLTKDGETEYKKLQTLAKLTQQMAAVEETLKAVYAATAQLAGVKVNIPLSKQGAAAKSLGVTVETTAPLPSELLPPAPTRKPRAKKVQTRENLSKNGKKVLTFLEANLKKDEFTPLTLLAIAQGSGVAAGSIPLSLANVVAVGAVVVGEKGTYKLGGN